LIAFGFFVLSVIALYIPEPPQDQVASLLRGSLLRPFVLAQESLVRRSIHAEDTEVLQGRLDSLQAVIVNGNTLSEENRRLRSLLGLSERHPARYVAASVMRPGTPGSESMFMLDVGIREGISKDAPVIMGGGLLGKVREARGTGSTAMDWTHPQFWAAAMTVDGSIYGFVEASRTRLREADRLILNGIPFHQELEPGDTLVTDGSGGVYPRGIPIGVVIEESESQEGWNRSYWLTPFVLPGEATHVQVMVVDDLEFTDANSWVEGSRVVPSPVAQSPVVPGPEAEADASPAGLPDTEPSTPR